MLHVEPGERLLEIGFGTGHGLVELAGLTGPGGQVYGLDLSLGMARETRHRLHTEGVENV
ncbi:2-heptaprenyl-1,4-naphthoquinone methyltransferase, partial [Enterococcus hirae]